MLEQRGIALAEARGPGGGIVEVRCAGNAGHTVAGHALGLEHHFAECQRQVRVADLDAADALEALGHVAVANVLRDAVQVELGAGRPRRLRARHHVRHQPDDDQNGGDEREEDREQQLLGVLDRAGMGVLCGLVVRVCAHGVLKIGGFFGGASNQPAIIGTPSGKPSFLPAAAQRLVQRDLVLQLQQPHLHRRLLCREQRALRIQQIE